MSVGLVAVWFGVLALASACSKVVDRKFGVVVVVVAVGVAVDVTEVVAAEVSVEDAADGVVVVVVAVAVELAVDVTEVVAVDVSVEDAAEWSCCGVNMRTKLETLLGGVEGWVAGVWITFLSFMISLSFEK